MSIRIGIGLGLIPTAARPAATTAPVNVVKPFFEGPLTQGQSADVNPGAWTGLPSPNFTYAIKRGATTVSTDPAYVWTSADVAAGASAMTVAVTATNDIGPTTETSDPVTIAPPLQLSGTPSDAAVGAPYVFTPVRSGGHAPFVFDYDGTLPTGLAFNATTGAITGTPIASGSADLTIHVVDGDGLSASVGPFELKVISSAPVNGDPIGLTVLPATAVEGISPDGWVAAVTFKGMAVGQTLDASKVSFTVEGPGYDATGAEQLVERTITGTAALRKPLPPIWAAGQSISIGDRRAYQSSGVSRYYTATSSGVTGATAPTHGTGSVSDGAVTWLYVGNVDEVSPPTQKVEAVSGEDAVVYVVLDQYVFAGETITGVDIGAGAYGASRASTNVATPSNNSTFAHLRPDAAWVFEPYQIAAGAVRVEMAVAHPFGKLGRTAACVKFKVRDSASGLVTSTVAGMEASTILTGGNPVPVFGATIDISGLADGPCTVEAEVYPFRGAAPYITTVHGFGPLNPTAATTLSYNVPKRMPFRKDAAGTFGRLYAYVDPASGVDASGVVSATAATAAASPYLSIAAAAVAIQAASNSTFGRNNCANHVIRLKAGTYANGFGAATMAARAMGDVWLTFERDPAAGSVSDVNITPSATAANRQSGRRVKYKGLTITGASSAAAIDNVAPTTLGDFTFESWFEGCVVTGVPGVAQKPVTREGLLWLINSQLTDVSSLGKSGARSAIQMAGGCLVAGTSSQLATVNSLGNKFSGGAKFGTLTTSVLAEGTGVSTGPDIGIVLASSWPKCTALVSWPEQAYTTGVSWVQNIIEAFGGSTVKGGQHSADANVLPIGHIYYLLNSTPGEGPNLAYNEVGAVAVQKMAIERFNASNDRNCKGDFYDNSPAANGARTGNFSTRFCVDFLGNAVFTATRTIPSASNLAGEVIETRTIFTGTPAWTDDRSLTGSGLGNGDYRPTTASSAKSRVLADEQLLPFDLNGTPRKTDGTGAAGALEWA